MLLYLPNDMQFWTGFVSGGEKTLAGLLPYKLCTELIHPNEPLNRGTCNNTVGKGDVQYF